MAESMLIPALEPPFSDEEIDDLAAWLEAPHEPESESTPRPARWEITDTASAEWAMRRLAHTTALIRQREAEAREFKRQIDVWLAGEVKPAKLRERFFAAHLEGYAACLREEQDQKSLHLPSGDVTSRRNPARFEVEDADTYVAWAKEYLPETVKAKWSPVADAIKKVMFVRTVVVPLQSSIGDRLFEVDDHLLAMPATMSPEAVEASIDGLKIQQLLDDGTFVEESRVVTRDSDGTFWLVPAVVEVPEHVTFTVKPALP